MATLTTQDLVKQLKDGAGLPTDKAVAVVKILTQILESSRTVRLPEKKAVLFVVMPDLEDKAATALREIAAATPSPHTLAAFSRALKHAKEPLAAAVLTRFASAIAKVLETLPAEALSDAAAAPTDLGAVLTALEASESLAADQESEALEAVRIRGLEARRQLLQAEGGAWAVQQAGRYLGITRQAVDKRRRAGRLLAVSAGRRGYLYPVWQFTQEGVLPGLEAVLDALRGHDPWTAIIFILSPNSQLGGKTPLQTLRQGRVTEVIEAAAEFGEHGAA